MGNSSSHHHKKHNQQRVKKNVHWTPENAEPPGPPGKPQLLPDSPHSDRDVFTIRWEPPEYDGGTPVQGYLVEHRRTGSPYWVRASPHAVEDTELMVSGLEPGWRYQFRVAAENAVGLSEPGPLSEPLTVTYQRSPAAAPSFVRTLHDTTALEDEKVEFTVQVEGIPTPKVSWYKDGFEIFSSRRQRIVTDNDISTLIIHQAALMDEGEIKCTATNRAGHAISKARLRLEAPPSIRLPKQYEDGLLYEMGEIIKLKVSVAGMPPPSAHWLHNGEALTSGGRYEITHTDKYLSLRINDARRADRGEYQAHAVNSLGEDMASFLVTVTDRPLPPGKAKVVMTLGKSVTLSWSEPEDDGGCKIGNYIVEYFRLGWNMWLKAATCRQLTTTLGDLIEGSEYKFRVKAENPYGVSDPSEESDVVFIPDPKRGLLEPPVKGQQSPVDSPSGFEVSSVPETWYDESKIRGREIKLSDQAKPELRNQKGKVWRGDDSLSSGSSVFLSDGDLNRMRNTSSMEGTPVVPKRRGKLTLKDFHKSGSLVSDYDEEMDRRRRRNTSLDRSNYSNKENSSLQSLDNGRHYERMSLEKEKPLYGTDDSLYRARNESLTRVKKSKSPSPMRHKNRSREATQSPLAFDSNSSPTSNMSPPPRRKRKSKSRSPSVGSPGSRRRNSSTSSHTKEKKPTSPLSSPKAYRDNKSGHEKLPRKSSSPQSSPLQTRNPSRSTASQPEKAPQRPLQNRFNLPDIANIATTSKQSYMDVSDGYTTTDLDEEELEAMAVKTVIQIKIKPEVEMKVSQENIANLHAGPNNRNLKASQPFKEDANKLGLHNLSEVERKKLSLGTQKSFEDKAERDLSDMLHGSSELMLLLLPNSSRENSEERELRKKEMSINLSIDNIMAPPVSLSAPEINDPAFYLEEHYDIPIREAFSSSELLHEKKMARLYQSLEEIEAENEEYKKRQMEKLQSVEPLKDRLTRKRSLTVDEKKKILMERRRSSEAEESDTGRKYGDILDRVKQIKSKLSEDEGTDVSDVNYVSDDNSKTEEKANKRISFGGTYHSDLETHNEDDYDIVENNEQHAVSNNSEYESDYYPEKTLHDAPYDYDSDALLEEEDLLEDDDRRDRSQTPVVKDDEYYENLGDVLTKKYSLPVNEIQIKIDKPDDEPDFVLKGKYEVDNEMLLKRAKLKPQYSSELSEASNITDDELDEEEEENEVDFDELFEENPEESGEEREPINFARNRYRYNEDEEEQIYHPRTMVMKDQEEDYDEPPPIPEHQDDGPELPERTSSIDTRKTLSPHDMLMKQPVKPILKNKGKKVVGKILDVEIYIDDREPNFDNIILKSPQTARKKKTSPEGARKSKLGSILKPILKKDTDKKDVEKDSENFKQFPVKAGGNILLIPKSLQKVSDVESDTDTEKARKKHVRITEPGNTSDENDLTRTAVINHYSDLVKEYGTKTKSAVPKMILNYEELKAKAVEVENGINVDWDKVVKPEEQEVVTEEYVKEMKDPFSVNNVVNETNRFTMETPITVAKTDLNGTELRGKDARSGRSGSKHDRKYRSRRSRSASSTPTQQRSRESSVTKDLDQHIVPDQQIVPVAVERQQRIHSYFEYTLDLFVFGIACWIYFFKHPILCVPILLLLLCKQIYENWESFLFWKKHYKQYEQPPK